MATVNPEFKNQFVVKYLELQLAGLEQYAKYLIPIINNKQSKYLELVFFVLSLDYIINITWLYHFKLQLQKQSPNFDHFNASMVN